MPLHDNLKRLLLDVSKLVLAPLSPCWLMYSHQLIRTTICLVFSYLLLIRATDQGWGIICRLRLRGWHNWAYSTIWIRQRKDAPITALVQDHLSLTILGVNLSRKRRMNLASTATTAASLTLDPLTSMSSLELALLSTAKSICCCCSCA
jgi:hypothetical protein